MGRLVALSLILISLYEAWKRKVLLHLPFLNNVHGIVFLFRIHDIIVHISSLTLWATGLIAVSLCPTSGKLTYSGKTREWIHVSLNKANL